MREKLIIAVAVNAMLLESTHGFHLIHIGGIGSILYTEFLRQKACNTRMPIIRMLYVLNHVKRNMLHSN